MDSTPRILADMFERESGVLEALRLRGVVVETRRLDAGDYHLPNGALVERKTVLDLHMSLRRGRFWPQIGRLRNACRLPYLLIEGRELDLGPLKPEAVRGACLAVLGQGVGLLPSQSPADSARWLHLLALRLGGARPSRDRPSYAQRLKPLDAEVPEAMLAAIPGISVTRARYLLGRFGSVAAVVEAGFDSWVTVPGIGPTRADAIRRALS